MDQEEIRFTLLSLSLSLSAEGQLDEGRQCALVLLPNLSLSRFILFSSWKKKERMEERFAGKVSSDSFFPRGAKAGERKKEGHNCSLLLFSFLHALVSFFSPW